MKASEGGAARQRTIILIATGAAAVLIAVVIGLSLGEGAAPEEADPTLTAREIFVEARKDALDEVRRATAEDGFREGRKAGAKQGGRAGRRAGLSDGETQVQLQITEAAQTEAAGAQSELGAIATPPPTP